jgi:hypothetical protein
MVRNADAFPKVRCQLLAARFELALVPKYGSSRNGILQSSAIHAC